MKLKILCMDANGKISLTKRELEQLLEESYQDGVEEGRKMNYGGGQLAVGGSGEPYWVYGGTVTSVTSGLSYDHNELEGYKAARATAIEKEPSLEDGYKISTVLNSIATTATATQSVC